MRVYTFVYLAAVWCINLWHREETGTMVEVIFCINEEENNKRFPKLKEEEQEREVLKGNKRTSGNAEYKKAEQLHTFSFN